MRRLAKRRTGPSSRPAESARASCGGSRTAADNWKRPKPGDNKESGQKNFNSPRVAALALGTAVLVAPENLRLSADAKISESTIHCSVKNFYHHGTKAPRKPKARKEFQRETMTEREIRHLTNF